MAFEHIELLWTAQNGNAMATLKSRGKPATTSILFSGKNLEEESDFLSEVDQMLGHWGMPPAGITIIERPLLVTIPWPIPHIPKDDLEGIADMETCLAAAFFERSQPLHSRLTASPPYIAGPASKRNCSCLRCARRVAMLCPLAHALTGSYALLQPDVSK